MNRRDLLQQGLLGGAAALLPAGQARSKIAVPDDRMAGGIYLTADNPGRWHRKVNSHLPIIEVEETDGAMEVIVTTRHAFTGYKHYIIKHKLLDSRYRFLAEHVFDPFKDDKALCRFRLEGYRGTVHALSVCNRHDSWLASFDIV